MLGSSRELHFKIIWEQTKKWRYDVIEQAVQNTEKKGAKGLQRMELFCELGRSLGMPKDQTTILVDDLIDYCTSKEQKLAMEVFLKWTFQCHHYNQAKVFGTVANFPVYNLDEDFIFDSLFRSTSDPITTRNEGIQCQVKLPPIKALLSIDTSSILDIRNELGRPYLYTLEQWNRNPTDKNGDAVIESLKEYCSRICSRFHQDHLKPLIVDYVRNQHPLTTLLGKTAAAVTSNMIPATGIYVAVGNCFCCLYRYLRQDQLRDKLKPENRQIEVNLLNELPRGGQSVPE